METAVSTPALKRRTGGGRSNGVRPPFLYIHTAIVLRCCPPVSKPHATSRPPTRTADGSSGRNPEQANTLNRAFDEPSMTMPILLADVIPALAEFDQDATTASDPDDYRDRIVLHDGSIVL